MPTMTQPPRDMLADLERHAELLGANVAKLTRALDHWRLLEAEYEALADEVRRARADFASDPQAQQADLVRIRRDFDGQLVDHRTVCELFGARLGQPITRSCEQIASAVGRRLDYVRQNAATLQKQVEAAANRLAAAAVVRHPGAAAGGGGDEEEDGAFEPVTDIVEELDDDDNVINVRLNTPSTVAPHVLSALKQAGIDDELSEGGDAEGKKAKEAETKGETAAAADSDARGERPTETQQTQQEPSKQTPKPNLRPNLKPRRSVAFSEDTKGGHEDTKEQVREDEDDEQSNGDSDAPPPPSLAAQRLERVLRAAAEQESMVRAVAAGAGAGPADESSEDAALRREMLEYSKSEIGPIVAQLDLEEGSDPDADDYDEDGGSDYYDYDDDEEDDDDDEDEFGRAKYSVIDEAYRERMKALEQKLGVARPLPEEAAAASLSSPPAAASERPLADAAEKLGRIRIASDDDGGKTGTGAADVPSPVPAPAPASVLKKTGSASGPKKVAFAPALDVATPDADAPIAAATTPAAGSVVGAAAEPPAPRVEPVRDVVVERGSGSSRSARAPAPPGSTAQKKPSRFRMAREGSGAPLPTAATTAALPKGPHEAPVRFLDQERAVAPSGPAGQTLAAAVVERQPPAASAREPDELDAGILLQETAAAYHRTRNRLIQQQGGFLRASEAAVVPLDEAEGGPRVSKFKAARLGKQFLSP